MGCERPPVFCGLVAARVVVVIVPLPPAAVSRGAPCVAARWLACGPLSFLFLFVAPADAAWEVGLTAEVSVATEYSDNITAASEEAEQLKDLELSVTPDLSWSLDRQALRFDGRSGVRVERFLDHGDFDGEDWHHRLGATWHLNERWILSALEDWRQSRNLDDLIEAGEIVVQREQRTTNEARAALTWIANERTQGSLAYTNYDSQSERPANTDYLLHMVAVNLSTQATEKLGVFTGANVQDYDFNPLSGTRTRFFTRNYALFVGGGYQLTERLSANVQAGGRLTEQTVRFVEPDFTTIPVTFTEAEDITSTTGATFDLSATYRLARGQIKAHASQDLTASAGASGTVERRTFGLSASDWFAPDWQWNAAVSYSENQSESNQAGLALRDSHGTYLSVGLSHRINDYLDAKLQARRIDFQDAARGTDVERHTVVLTVTGHWPQSL